MSSTVNTIREWRAKGIVPYDARTCRILLYGLQHDLVASRRLIRGLRADRSGDGSRDDEWIAEEAARAGVVLAECVYIRSRLAELGVGK